ncbi:MAG: ribonuclease P protein component [Deltaproteobacteria bacterium]|nr:ribonuclease P protein component [Deltaproteobacteria bacterium]
MANTKQNLTFKKDRRVRKRAEFLQIQNSTKRGYSEHFLLTYKKEQEASAKPKTRFGITISKKVDKRAVCRNRLRRRIREFLRIHQECIAPGLAVVIIAKPQSVDLTFSAIAKELKQLLIKLRLWLPKS